MKVALVIIALLVVSVAQAQAFKPEKAASGTLCTICTFVANVVEEYIQNNATEAKIAQALGKVCNLFGGFAPQVCRTQAVVFCPFPDFFFLLVPRLRQH